MLLLRGKFQEAAELSNLLKVPKWIAAFDAERPLTIDQEILEKIKPCFYIIKEIKDMLDMNILVNMSTNLLNIVLDLCNVQIEQVKIFNNQNVKVEFHYFKWACILIKSFGLENDTATGRLTFTYSVSIRI